MSELKPCPFCGSEGTRREEGTFTRILCDKCNACSPPCCGDEDDMAFVYAEDAWNTRPIEDALQERIEDGNRMYAEANDLYADTQVKQFADIERLKTENDAHEKGILEKEVVRKQADEIVRLKSDRDRSKERYKQLFIDFVERGAEIERLKAGIIRAKEDTYDDGIRDFLDELFNNEREAKNETKI